MNQNSLKFADFWTQKFVSSHKFDKITIEVNQKLFKIDILFRIIQKDFPGGSDGKASAYHAETWVRSLGGEDPMEKEMATHSITIAWRIPWLEELGGLQSMGLQRVGQN